VVPEREIIGLQERGSARLSSYLRGRETATYVTDGAPVRRWRTASYGPLLAWFLVLTAIVVGSRSFIDKGVPAVGEFLPLPPAGDLVDAFRSAWDPRGAGASSPAPSGWFTTAMAMVAGLFRSGLAMTVWVLALVVIGAAGAWRLATVFPATRARVAVLVVYVGTPLMPGVLGSGDLEALVWFAVLPWLVHLARRSAGIDTADPDMVAVDLTDGVIPVARRSWIRFVAGSTVLLGVAAAMAPVTVVLWTVAGLVLALATLLARASAKVAGSIAALTVLSVVGATVLNLPWSTTWSWSSMAGPQVAGGRGDGVLELASLSIDGQVFGVLALALYVPLVAAVAICRAWRLSWAVRGAGLVVVFGAIAVLADQDLLGVAAPDPRLLLVPVALGLAVAVGSLAGGFGVDVLGRGFGWRQPLVVVAAAAAVVALVPGIVSVGDGQWGAPRTTVPTLVAASLEADPAEGDYRVLYVGDPRVLPVPAREYRDGIAYALVDDGPLDLTDRWATPTTLADDVIVDALDRIADGTVSRAGRLLAPLGIRYLVIPTIDGVESTAADPIAVPVGLLDAIGDQLDLGQEFGPPTLEVFANRSWFATTALLTGEAAAASLAEEPGAIVQLPVTPWQPLWPGSDRAAGTPPTPPAAVEPGTVHVAVVEADGWHVELDGVELAARTSFGSTAAFDVAGAGTATLRFDEPTSRTVMIGLQVLLWLVALVAASRARSPFDRRITDVVDDETLIDLDDDGPDADVDPLLTPTWAGGDDR
jgi:hypothetical protein